MQKQVKFFLGMDVSKQWVDIAIMKVVNGHKPPMVCERFDNTLKGMERLHTWLQGQQVPFGQDSLLVIENTGVYHRLVWQYCSEQGLPLYIGNATDIKYSFGIARGKSDVVDSQRLCQYAYRHAEDLRATAPLERTILKLKDLTTARSRLIRQRSSIRVFLKELRRSNDAATQELMQKVHKAALEGIEKSLKEVEQHIKATIKQSAALQKNYQLLLSVPGIGPISALYLIGCTGNFQAAITGKQLASYAGVVPFCHTSGSSIKGKPRVHKMANKELKRLLHMGAVSAKKNYAEFRDYFDRKTSEGKHTLSVLNAIRNKIVLRAVAVIKKQAPYVDQYAKAA